METIANDTNASDVLENRQQNILMFSVQMTINNWGFDWRSTTDADTQLTKGFFKSKLSDWITAISIRTWMLGSMLILVDWLNYNLFFVLLITQRLYIHIWTKSFCWNIWTGNVLIIIREIIFCIWEERIDESWRFICIDQTNVDKLFKLNGICIVHSDDYCHCLLIAHMGTAATS